MSKIFLLQFKTQNIFKPHDLMTYQFQYIRRYPLISVELNVYKWLNIFTSKHRNIVQHSVCKLLLV